MLITHSLSKSDKIIFKEVFYSKVYDCIRNRVQINKIVDIGASFGAFTLFAADMYPDARIDAYEPTYESYSILDENIKRNRLVGVTALNLAVWVHSKGASLFKFVHEGLNSLVYDVHPEAMSYGIESVQTIDLDTVIGNETIDILKIDCEGAEYDILYKCSKLKKVRFIVGEYHMSSKYPTQTGDSLMEYLQKQGFKTIVMEENKNTGMFYAVQN